MFTRRDNLRRHVKEVHVKEKRYQCGICKMGFAQKTHKEEHLKTCLYKTGAGRRKIEFTPIRVSSAFGGVFAEWKVDIPEDYDSASPHPLLRAALHVMEDPILKHNAEHTKRLKFTASAYVVFQQATDPEIKTEPPVGFTTWPWTVLPATDVLGQLESAYDDIVERIEKYEGRGTGWIIDYLDSVTVTITSYI